jgi:multicomponent Na+:H+ antiporter subunit G
MSTFRIIVAIVLLSVGMLFILLSVIGVFRMKFVMNRMHAAALGDTCGLLFMILGLICIGGFTFTSLKLLGVLVLFWLTSPVSGHLLSNMVKSTMNSDLEVHAGQKELENKAK